MAVTLDRSAIVWHAVMVRIWWVPVLFLGLSAAIQQPTRPQEKTEAEPPGLRATQLAIGLDDRRGDVSFRASVVARDTDRLVVLTAAHCLSAEDVGRRLRMRQGENAAVAVVRKVVHNPSYEHGPKGAIPGADNALIVLEPLPRDAAQKAWIDGLGVATLSVDPMPDPGGAIIPVFVLDQREQLHRLRAGNFSNPRWLEWGPRYQPIPGDSGSGVFILQRDAQARAKLVLIGVVTDRSQLGGGASVVFLRLRWLAEALASSAAGTRGAGDRRPP